MNKPRFPSVGFVDNNDPYRHEQFIPGSPMRFPGQGEVDSAPMVGAPGLGGPVNSPNALQIFDAHHYAVIIELTCSPANGVSGKFLDMPNNKRNYLALRNTSATANIYIGFGRAASLASVIRLAPNTMILFDAVVSQDDVYAMADAAAASLSYAYSTIK